MNYLTNYQDFAFWSTMLGGLGLFLYGIFLLSSVLKKGAGQKLRKYITKFTNKPIKGVAAGIGFTAIIQSSSGTTALVIGLVRAGVMLLPQAVAVIIGANIGTTITAFLISIPFAEYVPIVILIGTLIIMLAKRKRWIYSGEFLVAFGSVFFGLVIMENSLGSLSSEAWFSDLLIGLNNSPWLGLLVGIIATIALQSSSAVIGVLQGIYAVSTVSGVTLFGVLPILFGANIGTCITAVLAAIGGSPTAKRTAFVHVVFNVLGALLFMVIIYIFKGWLLNSPSWSMDPKLQIAVSHIIFNLTTTLIVFPFINPLCRLAKKVIKGNSKEHSEIIIKELDDNTIKEFPSTGIELAKQSTFDMFDFSIKMFTALQSYLDKPNQETDDYIHDLEKSIDRIDRQLNEYLLKADQGDLNQGDLRTYGQTLRAIKDIERIGDYGENLIDFYAGAIERKNKIEGALRQEITIQNDYAIELLNKTKKVYELDDKDLALDVIKLRRKYVHLVKDFSERHYERTSKKECNAMQYISLVYVDINNCYERVYSHCSNIAKLINNDKRFLNQDDDD
ncbi:MAG: Na/Pi cotransporter family protein [Bacilli bacterium]|nr:Na/Pi cotransporter family protein [Bacilli bacterium]